MQKKMNDHKRILVLGCPGAGKTTLAQQLSQRLSIPLYQMDELYWLEGWQRPQESEFLDVLQTIVNTSSWIIEGNYYRYLAQRLPYAELIILVQVPIFTCLWRALKRFFLRYQTQRAQPFRWQVASKFVFNILSFNYTTLPSMWRLFSHYRIPVYVIKRIEEIPEHAF